MPTVSGSLLFVSSRAAHVSEVWVRAPKVRTHAEGLVTTGNDHFPVIDGQVEFTAVPGPAVLALISQGRAVDTVPIVVGDSDSQTLSNVVNAAEIADDATKREIEKLAAQAVELVDSSTENARQAQDGATRAETAAGEAESSATSAEDAASKASSSASSANQSSIWVSNAEQRTAKSASSAEESADAAKDSASSAAASESAAKGSAAAAESSAMAASSSASKAATSEKNAAESAADAASSAASAKSDADRAAQVPRGKPVEVMPADLKPYQGQGWLRKKLEEYGTTYDTVVVLPFDLDTSDVTDMASMFFGCSSLISVPTMDTSSVTNMRAMFSRCSSLIAVPPMDTSQVTNMMQMFVECSSLISVPPMDTSNATNMTSMFDRCSSLIPAEVRLYRTDGTKPANTKYMIDDTQLTREPFYTPDGTPIT